MLLREPARRLMETGLIAPARVSPEALIRSWQDCHPRAFLFVAETASLIPQVSMFVSCKTSTSASGWPAKQQPPSKLRFAGPQGASSGFQFVGAESDEVDDTSSVYSQGFQTTHHWQQGANRIPGEYSDDALWCVGGNRPEQRRGQC